MRNWLDIYPTGRKHCSSCKRWRHGIYFNARQWADEPHCTIPLYLQSVCAPCLAENNRKRNGWKSRNLYQFGKPGSEKYRKHTNKRNSITRKKARRRRAEAEYKRIWRESKRAAKLKSPEDDDI